MSECVVQSADALTKLPEEASKIMGAAGPVITDKSLKKSTTTASPEIILGIRLLLLLLVLRLLLKV
jgi:hypothetical protein